MSALQHCPACDQEYVAGVAACVDCGGPLTPGPLARFEESAPRAAADQAGTASTRFDWLLGQLPGARADEAVRALLLEGISCRVECAGLGREYTPERPPSEPFAVSLPVAVYVASQQLDAAQEILASLEHEDLIGEQWSDADQPEAMAEIAAADDASAAESDGAVEGAIEPEGTSLRTAVLIVVIVAVLLFLFGRS